MSDLLTQLNGGSVPTLDIIMLTTFAALIPSIVVMMTSFTRTIIIISFTRNAMGVQQAPPNMVLVGITLFLTLYIMNPVIQRINEEAYQPYLNEEITQEEAVERATVPLKEFMVRNTYKSTLDNFVRMSNTPEEEQAIDYPLTVIVPSFMTRKPKFFESRLLLTHPPTVTSRPVNSPCLR